MFAKWYNETMILSIKEGAATSDFVGNYTLKLWLRETKLENPLSTLYFLRLVVLPKRIVPVVEKEIIVEDPTILYPEPSIMYISNKGLVTVLWNEAMEVPFNLTMFNQQLHGLNETV